jgi:hypothetical protein
MTKAISKADYFQTIGYTPHSRQKLFHDSKSRFRIPVCGRRFGKSRMAAADVEPELFIPNRRYWIVGPTYDLGEKEFRYIWQDLIVDQKLGRDKRVRKAYNKKSGDMYIEFPWQTRIEVRSAAHPESLVGDSLDGVIMSEAAKHGVETWERYIRAALTDNLGWATFPTTPEGQNWLYILWLFGRDESNTDYASWRFPSWENPYVFPKGKDDPEIQLIRRTTTDDWFDQEIAALFTAFVGKIYSEFDEMVHVKPWRFDPNLPNYISFDWGFVNPLAAVEFQVDSSDNVHVWREHYRSYTTLPEHAELLKKRDNPSGYHLTSGFGDAEDPEAVTYMSQHLVPIMALPEAKKNWRQGVDLVKRFLKTYPTGVELDEFGTPEEKPKLTIDPSCVETIREHSNYRARKGTLGQNPRELPQNVSDHTCDALRYGLMHLYELGAKHHLDEVDSFSFEQEPVDTYFNSQSVGSGAVLMDQRF